MTKSAKAIQTLIFIVVVAASFFFSFARDVQKRVLMAADDHDRNYPTTLGLERMKEIVERETGGRIQIIIRPNAQLGSEKETIELTQIGIIDINRVSCAPMATFSPEMKVLSLPYLFRDGNHEFKVLDGEIGRELMDKLETRRLVGLTYYDSGARSFYNKLRPINKPDDLKGLKIRVQNNEVMIKLVETLGGSPDPIAFEEVYSAIQTGRIDGAENNFPSYDTTSHFEVAKYYSLDEHSRIPEIVLFNKQTWDSLSGADREIFRQAAAESQAFQKEKWLELEILSKEKVEKAGVKINTPDKAAFIEKVKPIHDEYRKQFGTLIDKIENTK
jgi:tripartite ATP-independent transporter DctP family solute receptor